MEEETQTLLRQATAAIREPPSEVEGFAALIAAKLHNLEQSQRVRCEPLIFKAISMASLGQLDGDTDIVRIASPVLAAPPAPAPPLHEAALAPGTSSPPGTQPPRTRATGKAAGKTAEKTAGKAAGKKKPKK